MNADDTNLFWHQIKGRSSLFLAWLIASRLGSPQPLDMAGQYPFCGAGVCEFRLGFGKSHVCLGLAVLAVCLLVMARGNGAPGNHA